MPNQIVVVSYDPKWIQTFEMLQSRIQTAVGNLIERVEHVGSTSVPGLCAKPIVDLDVVIRHRNDLDAVIKGLEPLGYHHQGDLGIPGREAFTRPAGLPSHNLYVCAIDCPELLRHTRFRDYLRLNQEAVKEYGEIKKMLAAKHGNNIDAYVARKTCFIEQALDRAALGK